MMRFEWDDGKALGNVRKHGITFELATLVFEDPELMIVRDRVVDGVQRWHAVGWVRGVAVLLVVHTVNEDEETEIYRIISARRATRREVCLYQSAHS